MLTDGSANTPRTRFGRSITWLATGALAGSLLLGAGCSKETQAKPEGATAAALSVGPSGPSEPAAEPKAASAKFSEANFELEMRKAGPGYKVGESGFVEVVLAGKSPFKCNDKYPYKMKLKDADGVKFPTKVVKKDAATIGEDKVVMKVAFTPETAGKKKIAGRFSFSVCTDDKCLIEKRDLALDVLVN